MLRLLLVEILCLFFVVATGAQTNVKPNVIIVITDDQGYGDLGITGNPHIKTPTIDSFAGASTSFDNFYVSPVCAPTRSSLMTGRYSLRTGMRDTYNGGAIMAGTEITIAEMLKAADYRTGAFGKWHLGDNFPGRPNDQGFDESVIHLAGGMGQVGDFTTFFQGDSSYFNPVLWHNGNQEKYDGYCSDIFTDQALGFISENHQQPFFCYLAFNAPHTPLQVPEEYYDMYRDIDPSAGFEADGRPFPEMTEKDKEDARKVYAMVSNIDDNFDRLLSKLDELGISDNTIVIFMTDNGPQQRRYVAGLRGRKGDVYRGGVRVPFFLRFPSQYQSSNVVTTASAHIDILPTIADLCNVQSPKDRIIDGHSLRPLLEGKEVEWSDRSLFFYWTRRYPELYNNMALQKGDLKLVGKNNYDAPIDSFELFDLVKDPYEQENLVKENEQLALNLRKEMDSHYWALIQSDNLVKPLGIAVGDPMENPTFLSRNDADGERGIWSQEEIYGYWNVHVNPGVYNFKFKFVKEVKGTGRMVLEVGPTIHQKKYDQDSTDLLEMKDVKLLALDGTLLPFYLEGDRRIFPFWVEIEKVN